MTLNPSSLKDSISHFFKHETMPNGSVPNVVRDWLVAYAKYAQDAIAGGTRPSPLIPSIGPNGTFFSSLDSAMRTMWTSVAWTGPSLVGTTLFVPPLVPLLESSSQQLIKSRDSELALSIITNVLHTYTLGITVSVIPPTGIAVVVPLV